ncbi:MAG: RCC1 domain-containing protein [Polyangiales bacterium]
MLRRFAFLLLCVHGLACADTTPTRTLVRFSTSPELRVPEGALLRVIGYASGVRQYESGETLGMFDFEEGVTLPVEPEEDDGARRFTVFAELLSPTGARISWARVRSGFEQDERREVRVEFQARCQDPSDRAPSLNYDPSVACGSHDTCAALDGAAACRSACLTPEPVDSGTEPSAPVACPPEDDIGVEELEHGTSGTCALAGGEAFCWSQMSAESPLFQHASRVVTPDGRATLLEADEEPEVVLDIAASEGLTCMLLAGGALRCAGEDSALQELSDPGGARCCQVELTSFPPSTAVETAGDFVCSLAGGELFCSGRVPPHDDDDDPVFPAQRYARGETPSGWTQLFAAPGMIAALGAERLELLTGPSDFDFAGVELPRQSVADVALSANGLCVVDVDGALRCWGAHTPQELGGGWRHIAIAERSSEATGEHRCGIRVDGTLWCWGASDFGMLGVEARGVVSFEERVQVGAESDWIDVSVGERASCGVREGGHVYCWGSNQRRELGADGPDTHVPQHVPVPRW